MPRPPFPNRAWGPRCVRRSEAQGSHRLHEAWPPCASRRARLRPDRPREWQREVSADEQRIGAERQLVERDAFHGKEAAAWPMHIEIHQRTPEGAVVWREVAVHLQQVVVVGADREARLLDQRAVDAHPERERQQREDDQIHPEPRRRSLCPQGKREGGGDAGEEEEARPPEPAAIPGPPLRIDQNQPDNEPEPEGIHRPDGAALTPLLGD